MIKNIHHDLSYYNLPDHNPDDDIATMSKGTEAAAGITTIIISSRPTTPESTSITVIPHTISPAVTVRSCASTPSTPTSRRSTTPVIEVEDEQGGTISNYPRSKWEEILVKQGKAIQETLIKQGKQIRALYELQKSTNEKLTWVQNQVKSQRDKKDDIDLDQKVFMVSNSIFQYRNVFRLLLIIFVIC